MVREKKLLAFESMYESITGSKYETATIMLFSYKSMVNDKLGLLFVTYIVVWLWFVGETVYPNSPTSIHLLSYVSAMSISALIFLNYDRLGIAIMKLRAVFSRSWKLPNISINSDGLYFKNMLVVIIVLLQAVFISGILGLVDAITGTRDFSGEAGIHMTYVVSSKSMTVFDDKLLVTENNGEYVYGPLGFVLENERYLYLIDWKEPGNEDYNKRPTLYLVSQNEHVNLRLTSANAEEPTPTVVAP